jgi:hypothetical protein
VQPHPVHYHGMTLKDVEQDLPILMCYYDEVVTKLEHLTTKAVRRVSRKAALEMFVKTRNFKATAKHLGVSPRTINHIVYLAFRTARRLAGLKLIGDG